MPELILDKPFFTPYALGVGEMADKAKVFRVNLSDANGFSPVQMAKLQEAVALWAAVWTSRMFFEALMCAKLIQTEGLSNDGVYKRLLEARERMSPELDHEADISVTLDKRDAKGVMGYTYPSTRMQWIYNAFFERGTVPVIAGNLAHEYAHKLGFHHSHKWTKDRARSVPYQAGYLTRDIGKKIRGEA